MRFTLILPDTSAGFGQWSVWVWFIVISSCVGVLASHRMPWRDDIRQSGVPIAFGFLLGPFLLGLVACGSLIVLDGADPVWHLVTVSILLILLTAALSRGYHFSFLCNSGRPLRTGTWPLRIACVVLCAAVVNVVGWALILPLIDNDASEYGLVGRAIFEAASLHVYPLVDSSQSSSGLFAPWTHPPLYPVLAYLTYAIQGSSAYADIFKTVALWFVLATLGVVILIGRLHAKVTGWVAGGIFLSTPLLMIGAFGASIDALPIAGMMLIIVLALGFDRRHSYSVAWSGVLLGTSLWTHSQAVLFLPVFFILILVTSSIRRWRESVRFTVVAILVAVIVAAYPYGKNLLIYGSLISDNPGVVGIPSLDWVNFLKYSRSIYDWYTRLQYGAFKGLLSPQSYGMIFLLVGLVCVQLARIYRLEGKELRRLALEPEQLSLRGRVLFIPFCAVAIYYLGLIGSIIIGNDLIIKNDRYILVTAPAAALVVGFGVGEILYFLSREKNYFQFDGVGRAINITIFTAILLHLSFALFYGFYMNAAHITSVGFVRNPTVDRQGVDLNGGLSSIFKLDGSVSLTVNAKPEQLSGGIAVMSRFDKTVSDDETVFATRPADFYHTNRRMVSYIDPRMRSVYLAPTFTDAAVRMREMGIGFVQATNYMIPMVTNTKIMDLLANPDFSTLLYDVNFNQLYKLVESSEKLENKKSSEIETDLLGFDWISYPKINISPFSVKVPFQEKAVDHFPHSDQSLSGFFPGNYSSMLEMDATDEGNLVPVSADFEYTLDINVSGEGYIRVWIWKIRQSRHEASMQLAGDFVLSDKVPSLRFRRRFRVDSSYDKIRIGIERYGRSKLTLENAYLISRPVANVNY